MCKQHGSGVDVEGAKNVSSPKCQSCDEDFSDDKSLMLDGAVCNDRGSAILDILESSPDHGYVQKSSVHPNFKRSMSPFRNRALYLRSHKNLRQ